MATETKKVINRRDTAARWASVNPILSSGEIGVDTTNNAIKIGDGVTPWNELPEIRRISIEQTTGSSTDSVMSQEAVTSLFNTAINGGQSYGVDLSAITQKDCSLGSSYWYSEGEKGRHKAFEVNTTSYNTVSVRCGEVGTYIGFLTSAYSTPYNGADIPYVNGTDRIEIFPDTSVELPIPTGTAYVVLVTVDGAGATANIEEVTLSAKGVKEEIDTLKASIDGGRRAIDMSSITQKDFSLGGSGWFMDGNNGRHKVFELDQTKYNTITVGCGNGGSYIGFMTSAYKTPTYYGEDIPYVSGTDRIEIFPDTSVTLPIPSGTAYIVLVTVDGAGTAASFNEVTLSAIGVKEEVDALGRGARAVFCAMSYNVGGWYNGSGTSIPSASAGEYIPLQRKILGRYSPDMLFLQEYRDEMTSGVKSSELLKGYNVHSYLGGSAYNGKLIAARTAMQEVTTGRFTHYDGILDRYYLKGYIYCNGRKVMIMTTHLSTVLSHASSQLSELLELVRGEEYVIVGMDSNIDARTPEGAAVLKKIEDAGLIYANKDVVTYPSDAEAIDNFIVTPNITIRSVYADTEKEYLGADADHYPLLSYMEIY